MMMPHDLEGVAQERLRDWDKEIHQHQTLAQLPQEPARWRRWTGGSLVWTGTWLLRWGERMAARECQESVTVAG